MLRAVIVFFIAFLPLVASAADDIIARQYRAEAYAKEIIELRKTLAREYIKPGVEITPETFMQVCGAVGMRVKEIAEKEGFIIRHAAIKYRNPANKATPEEAELIKNFVSEEEGVLDEWELVERG